MHISRLTCLAEKGYVESHEPKIVQTSICPEIRLHYVVMRHTSVTLYIGKTNSGMHD